MGSTRACGPGFICEAVRGAHIVLMVQCHYSPPWDSLGLGLGPDRRTVSRFVCYWSILKANIFQASCVKHGCMLAEEQVFVSFVGVWWYRTARSHGCHYCCVGRYI